MSGMRLRPTTAPRPTNIPAHWRIFNAPRPIYGDTLWNGPPIKGVFYAAVDPEGKDAALFEKLNGQQDADELVYVTEDALVALTVDYLTEEYGHRPEEQLIRDEHDWFWMRAINLLRDGTIPIERLQELR